MLNIGMGLILKRIRRNAHLSRDYLPECSVATSPHLNVNLESSYMKMYRTNMLSQQIIVRGRYVPQHL